MMESSHGESSIFTPLFNKASTIPFPVTHNQPFPTGISFNDPPLMGRAQLAAHLAALPPLQIFGTYADDCVQHYTKLQKEDRVREVLENMYAWGKQHAWDPYALKEHPG